MITFKIDAREHKLKDILLQSIDCEECLTFLVVECDNLFCGDFIIEIDNKPILIIERKTLADLVSSIKDKRYRVQKAKLIEHYKEKDIPIIYLIEGVLDYNPKVPMLIGGMDKYSVLSSIINTQIRDGIHVVNTNNLEDTFDFLVALLVRVCKDPSKYSKKDTNTLFKKEDLISKPKIESKQDLFFYQLTQVPGISAKTAQAFVDKFDNMKAFYVAFDDLRDEEKLKVLKDITIDDNTKKRRINSKVADNIVKYMF
jgi:DNA excision repair protein ERCC-4